MQPVLALALRLTTEMARGNLAHIRGRLFRSLALAIFALVLITTALSLLCAALVVALAQWIGVIPAMLSLAAVAAIAAMILLLLLSWRDRAPRRESLGLLAGARRDMPVDPLTIVLGALAVGLLLGRWKR